MAHVTGDLLAHGGVGGAIVEGAVVVSILALFVAVWQRSRARDDADRDA